jgi:regulator of sigma E protease
LFFSQTEFGNQNTPEHQKTQNQNTNIGRKTPPLICGFFNLKEKKKKIMNTAISFLIVLGLLIFVHEFGHFIFAKLFGIRVLKFSLGFGPKLFGKTHGDTEYVLSAFPLGGYVKMYGELSEEEVSPEDRDVSFSDRPVWQRFIIVAGGPAFNLIFAVIVFAMLFFFVGMPQLEDSTMIAQVSKDSPADAAGLKAEDVIVNINDQEISHWEDVSKIISSSKGDPVTITVKRNQELITITGQPRLEIDKNIFGEETGKRYILGISRSSKVYYEPSSLGESITTGFSYTWRFIYLTVMGIVKMIQKVIPASELGGPILIAQMAGKQMEEGWISLIHFTAIISINLGVLNLFPVPILDGGHLVFLSVEAIRKRPLSIKSQAIFQQIGLVLLLSLMAFAFYNDIFRYLDQAK